MLRAVAMKATMRFVDAMNESRDSSFKTTSVKTLNASQTHATQARWQWSKLAQDAIMAPIHAWIP